MAFHPRQKSNMTIQCSISRINIQLYEWTFNFTNQHLTLRINFKLHESTFNFTNINIQLHELTSNFMNQHSTLQINFQFTNQHSTLQINFQLHESTFNFTISTSNFTNQHSTLQMRINKQSKNKYIIQLYRPTFNLTDRHSSFIRPPLVFGLVVDFFLLCKWQHSLISNLTISNEITKERPFCKVRDFVKFVIL